MTQTDQILAALQRGPITALDALRDFGCFRLAARINDLRRAGHQITTHTIEAPGGAKVAQYRLDQPKQKGANAA